MKKVIGIILLVLGVLGLIGGCVNGSFAIDASARGAGNLIGMLIGYAALIIGGIALIVKSEK